MDDVVKQAILALADKNGGTLQPKEVVNAARNRESPLHDLFEWNDELAAEAHRIATARVLIRRVRVEVVVTELLGPRQVPVFARNAESGGYATMSWLAKDDDLAREAAILEFQTAAKALRRAQATAIQLGLGNEAVATIENLVRQVLAAAHNYPEPPLQAD